MFIKNQKIRIFLSRITGRKYKKTLIKLKLLNLKLTKRKYPKHLNNISSHIVEVDSIEDLKKIFNWEKSPILNDPKIYEYESETDDNERRLRDAETLATVMCNLEPKIALEIGTAEGHSTALMAINSPKTTVFTVNILPEEINSGEGGVFTSGSIEKERIGKYFRELGIKNIVQIFANTAIWEPNLGIIDVAFIDGCHDSDFVHNDTVKILKNMKSGSFILWHDFNPELSIKYDWIDSVCIGVEKLYEENLIKENIFHIKNSWIGVYKL